ncbi:hypothetical protein E4U42_004010 [Claviceps africana]|uniref:Peroxin 20 n=1 Tax=Claviceps africana TaxID=83212 RepID=A0A8K0NIJ4_9HYPO|nr:hypothetical protein E4U42_004010 [Claviceps africana]
MAEASCSGPSPFKRLVDHQSRDVSHHQDRLVDRAPGQSRSPFRSASQHGLGADNFNAFMDGAPQPTMPGMPGMSGIPHDPANRLSVHAAALQQPHALMSHHHHHHHHHHPPPPSQSELSQQARASAVSDATNWAADFTRYSDSQRMRSSPNMASSSSAMQMNRQQPMQMDFQSAFSHAFGSPVYGSPAAAGGSGFVGAPQAFPEADFNKEMSQWMSVHGRANMTEVDAAMDQIARELQLNEASLPAEAETAAATAASTTSQENPASARYTDLDTPELASLSLQDAAYGPSPAVALDETAHVVDNDTNDNDVAAAPKTRSGVSEAAERLLDAVQHEDGEKWQNSVFLSLMRDFRDGKKDIFDDEIRDTEAQRDDGAATR